MGETQVYSNYKRRETWVQSKIRSKSRLWLHNSQGSRKKKELHQKACTKRELVDKWLGHSWLLESLPFMARRFFKKGYSIYERKEENRHNRSEKNGGPTHPVFALVRELGLHSQLQSHSSDWWRRLTRWRMAQNSSLNCNLSQFISQRNNWKNIFEFG